VIGIDTNVLVRYLVQDNEAQSALATEIIENFNEAQPGFISRVTLVETIWVLTRAYKLPKSKIIEVIETLLRANNFIVEDSGLGYQALAVYKSTAAGFSDAFISCAGLNAGCTETFTFDLKAAELKGMKLLTAATKAAKH